MHLTRLELHGFKSFPQKTTLTFDPGVTAIVGPNGCGKSNVIDAVRWVLGEQRARALRSEKMEHVIFNGTQTKRALGMAEVALTVENSRGVLPTEYAEVTVARRLYRSGDSEYLLNGTVCRLKDVLDLFMDTGLGPGAYSVIELKMVEDILSENADDRRRLFEEAAGVTKYKHRRGQALRKLDATQADLHRLADLVDEVDRQVAKLKRQAAKAERAARLQAEIGAAERHLARLDFDRLAAERRTTDQHARTLRADAARLQTALTRFEAEVEARRAAYDEAERALAAARQALFAHSDATQRALADARLQAERADAAQSALDRLRRDADADAVRHDDLARDTDRLTLEVERAAGRRASLEADEAAAHTTRAAAREAADEARRHLQTAEAAAREAERTAAQARAQLDTAQATAALRDRQRADAEAEQHRTEAARTQAATAASVAAAALGRVRSEYAAAATAFADAESAARAAREALEIARAATRATERAFDAAATEAAFLAGLAADAAGLDGAAAFLLTDASVDLRPLADLLVVADRDAAAAAAALGPWMHALVVSTRADAHAAVARLQQAEQGRATFVVLDEVPHMAIEPADLLGAPSLYEEVGATDSRLLPFLMQLLLSVALVDTFGQAEALAARGVPFVVARDGSWAERGRAIHAGSPGTPAIARRLGVAERAAEAAAREHAAAAALDAARAVERDAQAALVATDLERYRAGLTDTQRTLSQAESEEARRRFEQERLADAATGVEKRLAALAADTRPADLDALAHEVEQSAHAAHVAAAAHAAAREASDAAEQHARRAGGQFNDARLRAVQAQGRLDAAQNALAAAAATRADLDRRAAARETERASAEERLGAAREQEAAHRRAADRLAGEGVEQQERVAAAEQASLDARAAANAADDALRTVRRQRDAARDEQAAAEVRLGEIAARQDALAQRAKGEFGFDLEDDLDDVPAAFDEAAARAALPGLRDQLRQVGAVNALALEQYEAESERLDDLQTQHADLQSAEATLLSTIREINRTASERFCATFDAVQAQFGVLFAELFGENATAQLHLIGDDPLEAAVEITARPKGKKPSVIGQLSGGEKTLTAIALLFAIYLVKPSPFCILDEVDAPLDDANVDRFMGLIRRFSARTQFILVTHNKLTMEAADRMYGVTMQDPGVSTLVGVQFGEKGASGVAQAA